MQKKRKSPADRTIATAVPVELFRAVEELARGERRSKSQILRHAIEEYIAKRRAA